MSVKGGEQVGVGAIRDLIGVLDREKEPIGVLVTLNKPTRDMEAEAAASGTYKNEFWQRGYQRIQILTIEQVLSGTLPQTPPQKSPFAKAPVERERAKTDRML